MENGIRIPPNEIELFTIMKSCLVGLLVLCFAVLTNAQSTEELKQQLADTKNDSLRIILYNELGTKYRKSEPDTAFQLFYKGLALAKRANYPSCLGTMHKGIGTQHFFRSDYDSALYHYNKCLDISYNLGDSVNIGTMLNNIGTTYSYKAEYDTAIVLLLRAYEVRKTLGSKKISSTLNNIGVAFQKLHNWELALKYHQEAAELKRQYNQKLSLSNSLNNIGIVLKHLDRFTEAIPYYEESLKIAEEFDDKYKQAHAHNNLAHVYQYLPELNHLAGPHYLKSIAIKEELKEYDALVNSYTHYGKWLMKQERANQANTFLEKAILLQEKLGKNLHTSETYKIQSETLHMLGRHQEAYEALKKSYLNKVDELNEDRNTKIAQLHTQFESERKEAEIKLLKVENTLQETRLKTSQKIQLAIGIGATIIVIVLILFFLQRSKKQKIEKEAQELQIEALMKRLADLDVSPEDLSQRAEQLNSKLQTPLSSRELEVLKLSFEEKTNNEIAEELFISINTVKFHLRNTYGKLGVNNRKEAMVYVINES